MKTIHQKIKIARDLSEINGKHSEAIKTLDDVVASAERKRPAILPYVFNLRGIMFRMLGQFELAMDDYNRALKSKPNDEQKSFAYCNIADIFRVAHADFARAHVALDDALTYAGNGTLMHAKAVDQRGLVFAAAKDWKSAIISYEMAHQITSQLLKLNSHDKEVRNRHGQVLQHLSYAYLHSNVESTRKNASKVLIESFRLFDELKDLAGILNTVATLGTLSLRNKDLATAIEHYEHAYKIAEISKDERSLGYLNLYLAQAYMHAKRYEDGLKEMKCFALRVESGFVTIHDLKVLSETYNDVRRHQRKFPAIKKSVDRADKYFKLAEAR